jgi:hypothetical protein
MSRVTVIITSREVRENLKRWIDKVDFGTRVEFKEKKRSTTQNDLMWAALTDVAQQARYHGMKMKTEDWKLLFIHALFEDQRERLNIVPSLSGRGFVPLGRSSSDLSSSEMSDLIELIEEYAARNGVILNSKNTKELVHENC